jgi:hypothetical protein
MDAAQLEICEEVRGLWAQVEALAIGESSDSSGVTIEDFLGAQYAIGALKDFWEVNESGFSLIAQAKDSLSQLIANSTHGNYELKSIPFDYSPLTAPILGIRFTESNQDSFYVEGINGFKLAEFFKSKFPDEILELSGEPVRGDQLPGDFTLGFESLEEAISFCLFTQVGFQYSSWPDASARSDEQNKIFVLENEVRIINELGETWFSESRSQENIDEALLKCAELGCDFELLVSHD